MDEKKIVNDSEIVKTFEEIQVMIDEENAIIEAEIAKEKEYNERIERETQEMVEQNLVDFIARRDALDAEIKANRDKKDKEIAKIAAQQLIDIEAIIANINKQQLIR
jgi:hypothetical protein